MYDELIKQLRDNAEFLVKASSGCLSNSFADTMCQAADAIEDLSMKLHGAEAAITGMKREIERMVVAEKPQWIPATERLPETGQDVLVKFPQNMAVASIDIGEWVVNSGDGWCTNINLAGGEKNPSHWMLLPEPPDIPAEGTPNERIDT